MSQDEGFRKRTSSFKLRFLHFLQRIGCFQAYVISANSPIAQRGKCYYSNVTHFVDGKTKALHVTVTW